MKPRNVLSTAIACCAVLVPCITSNVLANTIPLKTLDVDVFDFHVVWSKDPRLNNHPKLSLTPPDPPAPPFTPPVSGTGRDLNSGIYSATFAFSAGRVFNTGTFSWDNIHVGVVRYWWTDRFHNIIEGSVTKVPETWPLNGIVETTILFAGLCFFGRRKTRKNV